MPTRSNAARAALFIALLGPASVSAAHDLAAPPTVLPPREQWLASFDRMPEPALEALFLRCDREAWARVLNFEDGVRCAMAWDALLKRVFGDDVDALMAWWLIHRGRESAVD